MSYSARLSRTPGKQNADFQALRADILKIAVLTRSDFGSLLCFGSGTGKRQCDVRECVIVRGSE